MRKSEKSLRSGSGSLALVVRPYVQQNRLYRLSRIVRKKFLFAERELAPCLHVDTIESWNFSQYAFPPTDVLTSSFIAPIDILSEIS